ncbi:DTW domain-containing protein 1 [Dermatophagoides pteronyssinus]|uniref:DTW domain-containing protein 1 n=1 Tax=Dermatophagoides pteronyssinus TaxID=6956 RepID=A0ABQ8J2Z9_DERPT|nr:DTW domain-containing protein 1 [Dermatophagoides pteronyssinus]
MFLLFFYFCFHQIIMMTDSNPEDLYQDFFNGFNEFDANFTDDADNDEKSTNKIDTDWIDKFFGRRPPEIMRKDITVHLEKSFLEQCKNTDDPFDKFQIDDCNILNQINDRFICEKCHRSRLYYCYTCFELSPELIGKIPEIRLPIKIDIIKHPQELNGKSTSIHSIILSPKDVRIFTYPQMPDDWYDLNKIFLLFPKPGSKTVSDFLHHYYYNEDDDNNDEQPTKQQQQQQCFRYDKKEFPIERIVVIDR